METCKTIVAVAGATGRTGSFIVKELFQKGYGVRGLVRSSAREQLGHILNIKYSPVYFTCT